MFMGTELVVAIISGVVALSSAAIAIWGQHRATLMAADLQKLRLAEQQRLESEKTISHYREPLARAAYALQSRLFNILELRMITVYLDNGSEREQSYVVDNSAYLIAQYFAWTEIIRQDIQYIDLGEDEQTRKLAGLQDNIYALFQTDKYYHIFRVFAGEQRAIGEWMLTSDANGPECIGYAEFLDNIQSRPHTLIDALRDDVRALSGHLDAARPRLVALQNALIEMLDFLDPEFIRFPEKSRSKVSAATVSVDRK
jgi:hypothetical protein